MRENVKVLPLMLLTIAAWSKKTVNCNARTSPPTGSKFLQGGARPPTQDVVVFVDAHKDDIVEGRKLGVELICRMLQVAPSTYYMVRGRTPSARAVSDSVIAPELLVLWGAGQGG
jgi:hypothetical protein